MFSRFIRNQTYGVFHSCIFSLPYIVISEIGISFSIKDLIRAKSTLYRFPFFLVFHFHKNIDYNQPNFNPFPKTGVIFTPIKEGLVKRQLKMIGMEQKKNCLLTRPHHNLRTCLIEGVPRLTLSEGSILLFLDLE